MDTRTRDSHPSIGLTRRQAVGRIGAALGGLVAAACTPLRIALQAYPEEFAADDALVERTLRAFVLTVVPGAPDDDNVTRVFAAPFHPFGPHRGYFASDLCRRAAERTGRARFDRLPPAERIAVVQAGLDADPLTRRLYGGAILLAQIAVYGGIHDDKRGSPLIAFEGSRPFRGFDELTYPDPHRFLAPALTADGNPA
jgi:hypothetical protein